MFDYLELIKNDPALKILNEGSKSLSSLTDIEETLLLATNFKSSKKTTVIVKGNLYTAQQLYYRLSPLLKDDVLLFAMEESLRVEAVAASPSMYADQINVLSELVLTNEPKLIITHPMGLMRYLPTRKCFENHILNFKVNQQQSMAKIRQILIENGYKQTARVDQPLTFAMRGDVIDVFSIQNENPLRIEFFDDEIDSLRYFDLSSQRTIEKVNEATVVPASTLIYDEDFETIKKNILIQLERDKEKANSFNVLKENVERDLDYLKEHIFEHYLYRYQCFFQERESLLSYCGNFRLILDTPEDIESNLTLITDENNEYIRDLFTADEGLNYYSLFYDFAYLTDSYPSYKINSFAGYSAETKSNIKLTYFPLLPLDKVVEEIVRLYDDHHIVVSLSKGQYDLLASEFSEEKKKIDDYVEYTDIDFFEGFNYEDTMVLTAKELFGVKMTHGRYENKFKEASVLDSYQDLNINDYVVHNQYGIGQYKGIVTQQVQGRNRDYLQIVYRDGDLLLVPLEQFKLVRKYVAAEGVGIRLSKLGEKSWSKAKEKIEKEVNDIAQRLVDLYSAREENIGFAFSKDDANSYKFENNFPYELTVDQKKAIAEVKYDMEQPRPMDRLLCGDVGFGKTEVAMVAAFKAIKDLKQVAYLCPTTILSMQHYNTFIERFKGFPVKIKMLNRYIVESQQKEIIQQLKNGEVDIVIGTHRLLSNDVQFNDLGLLIIDEEQRFGVVAKEKIKELKKSIDVLSLSATPIPRTLQMALVGVMNLSQLNTAPHDRMPIQTYVVEKNDRLIKEVIQRELARNGQIFYLHNNVQTIYEVAKKIQAMVPQASIGIGHGKMNRDEIEDVMYRFVTGEYNILLCTTIIETGIDIPNANTIIIDNAENFGLAQLYQIRGRVGRSNRVAYAYLMYHNRKQLSEVATKRLQAIKDFTELGSGYKIAMRDLTIRGAGDLLGERQAGFINTVGMSLYLDMLNNAIQQRKGIATEEIQENRISIKDFDGYIPKEFVHEDFEKLTIYQKLAAIGNYQQLKDYFDKLNDYYGKLPNEINSLFDKRKIELLLNNDKIENYEELEKQNRLTLTKDYSDQVDGLKLFEAVSAIATDIQLTYRKGRIIFIFPKTKNYQSKVVKVLEVINKI